jgi:hypothetical protein
MKRVVFRQFDFISSAAGAGFAPKTDFSGGFSGNRHSCLKTGDDFYPESEKTMKAWKKSLTAQTLAV